MTVRLTQFNTYNAWLWQGWIRPGFPEGDCARWMGQLTSQYRFCDGIFINCLAWLKVRLPGLTGCATAGLTGSATAWPDWMCDCLILTGCATAWSDWICDCPVLTGCATALFWLDVRLPCSDWMWDCLAWLDVRLPGLTGCATAWPDWMCDCLVWLDVWLPGLTGCATALFWCEATCPFCCVCLVCLSV